MIHVLSVVYGMSVSVNPADADRLYVVAPLSEVEDYRAESGRAEQLDGIHARYASVLL